MDHMVCWNIYMVFEIKTIFEMSLQLFISRKMTVRFGCISTVDFTIQKIYHLAIRIRNLQQKS